MGNQAGRREQKAGHQAGNLVTGQPQRQGALSLRHVPALDEEPAFCGDPLMDWVSTEDGHPEPLRLPNE